MTWRRLYTGLALHFLYFLPSTNSDYKTASCTFIIQFTSAASLFLSGKKAAFGLQNSKVINQTSSAPLLDLISTHTDRSHLFPWTWWFLSTKFW